MGTILVKRMHLIRAIRMVIVIIGVRSRLVPNKFTHTDTHLIRNGFDNNVIDGHLQGIIYEKE